MRTVARTAIRTAARTAAKTAVKAKKPLSYERKKKYYGYLFILPWLVGAVFLFLRPLFSSVRLSLHLISLKDGVNLSFAGLRYYREAFVSDPEYAQRLAQALGSMLYEIPMIMVFSIAVGWVLSKSFRGGAMFKSLFFLPVIVASGVVIQIVRGDELARAMNDSTAAGSLFMASSMGDILRSFNVPRQAVGYLIAATSNLFNLTWKSGVQILIFISAFKSISPQIYEACRMEGATGWESFWKVTFPLVSPMIMTNLVYTIVDSFTDLSNPVVEHIQRYAQQGALGLSYGSAMSLIYFAIIFACLGIAYRLINRHVFYYN
jgi:ABC-type sugar transport system permease subunit